MRPSLAHLFQTTTFRLGVVQTSVVLAFVVLLLSYVYVATTGQLLAEAEAAAETEFLSLERVYGAGGIRQLTDEIEQRQRRRTEFVYSLVDSNGTLLAGVHLGLAPPTGPDSERVEFKFQRLPVPNEAEFVRARGSHARLLGGPILTVASDLSVADRISVRLTRALIIVAFIGMALAVISGLVAARQAARRAEALSRTTREVMLGDLSVRAPVLGAGDEFDQLAQDLNAMLGRLERMVRATRSASDAIAHDLRTPLSRQRQKLEAALERPPEVMQDRIALRAALAENDTLLTIFQAVLRLARVEAEANWKFAAVDVSGLVTGIFELYAPAAEEAGLSLDHAIAPHLLCWGEQTLLQQALSNLIENALKYTPIGGRLRIVARPSGPEDVEIEVVDDGPGVPPSDRERIIRLFERRDQARTTEGIGLGLSLVAAIARLHRSVLILRDGLPGGPERPGLSVALLLPRPGKRQVT
jgi:signal transduction histidine kinase